MRRRQERRRGFGSFSFFHLATEEKRKKNPAPFILIAQKKS